MSSLHEQVVEDLRSLSREEQDRVAEMLLAFLGGGAGFRLIALTGAVQGFLGGLIKGGE